MIKTLRITSISAAVVAIVLLILPAVFGVRSDPEIEELLKSPGAVDRFLAAKGQRPARDESQTSPLVKQAAAFSNYLNPPAPIPSAAPRASASSRISRPAPPAPVTPKFKLIGTSFYATRPELSLALIDEPGKGFNWVRQGNSIGHLTIEQIKDGSITIRDSHGSSEMSVTVDQPWRNLLKNPPPETTPAPASSTNAGPLPSGSEKPAPVIRGRPGFISRSPQQGVMRTAATAPTAGGGSSIEVSPQEEEKLDKLSQLLNDTKGREVTEEEMDKLIQLLEEEETSTSPDVND